MEEAMSKVPTRWFAIRKVATPPEDPRYPDRKREPQTQWMLINSPDSKRTGNWTRMFTHLVLRPEVEVPADIFMNHPAVKAAADEGAEVFLDYYILSSEDALAKSKRLIRDAVDADASLGEDDSMWHVEARKWLEEHDG